MSRFDGWQERMRQLVKRPIRLPHAAAGLAVLLVVIVLTANTLGPRPGPDPSRGPLPSSSNPATPSPAEQAWSRLDLAKYEQLADLAPVKTDASGVVITSAFTLRSKTTTPALTLAAGLSVQPAFAFTVAAGTDPAEVQIVPVKALDTGVRYRFSLDDPTGRVIGTWSYRTGHPLQIVGRSPDDQTTQVPTDTGIEMVFDQDGATEVAAHFSISPKVAGTFHVSGRNVAFAPDKPLETSTVYTVTLSPGVGIEGSDQILETGSTWSFETSGPEVVEPYAVELGLRIFETSPADPPILTVDLNYKDSTRPPKVPLQVYRLPSFAAARDAAATILADPGWPQLDSSGLVATTGLTRVLDTSLAPDIRSGFGYAVLTLPAPMPAGWYLLDIPRAGRDRQAILQVTDLAAWAMTSETRTVAWIHDIGTGDPVVGASLVDPAGARVGTTNGSGLIDVPTPASLATSLIVAMAQPRRLARWLR